MEVGWNGHPCINNIVAYLNDEEVAEINAKGKRCDFCEQRRGIDPDFLDDDKGGKSHGKDIDS